MWTSAGAPAGTRHSLSGAFPVLLTTGALTVAGLVLLSVIGFEILGSVRAYVHGEGEWSKAQRDAVMHLRRYARTGAPEELDSYGAAVAVNLHDRRARLALDRPDPDYAAARAGFIGGRNHPDDVPRMIRLFRLFRYEPHVNHAISVWAEADAEIQQLEVLSYEIARAHAASPAISTAPLIARIDAIDKRLRPLEREFSDTLGVVSRLTHGWLVGAIAVTGVILFWGGGVVVLRLVRDLGRSQAALLDSQQENAAILESALDAIITMSHDGRVVAFNAAAEQMFGVTRDEAIGKEMITLVAPPEMWEPHRKGLARYVAGGQARALNQRLEMTAARRNGQTFPVELTITRVPGTAVPRFTGFMRDLTERRQAEERLAHAQKLETVGRLAGGVAHDFNNVLTAILGFSEMLQERLESSGGDTSELTQIRVAAERARSLTAQLLAFSRKQMLSLEPLSLNALVTESTALIERLIDGPVSVRLELDARERPVRADAGQLQQVLLNLAINARDAMPDGGLLTLATQLDADGTRMRLSVADTGCGMTPDVQARIFEPFFTTKGPARGTGLGLATAYGTISQLGGTITVESAVNAGSCFHIVLPVTTERPGVAPAPVRARATGKGRVLVVEDETAVRELVRRVLHKRGYEIRVAASAEDALALLDGDIGSIDLLLSDMVMPGMNGHALASRLRADRPDLKVVLMSGYSEEQVRRQSAARDDLTLLRKPFTVAQLEQTIAAAIDQERPAIAS